MPDHLIVIRSGPTEYDLQGRIRGTLDVPLAATGIAAAEAAAAALAPQPPDALYVAADAAARETSRPISRACGLKARPLPLLANLDQCLWQGMLVDEIRCKQPRLYRQWQDNPWAVAPPEGELLEDACGRKAEIDFQPIQPGDVPATYANIDAIRSDLGYEPTTSIEVGVPNFVRWYREYHGV